MVEISKGHQGSEAEDFGIDLTKGEVMTIVRSQEGG